MAIGLVVGFVALRLGMGLATTGFGPDRVLSWLGGSRPPMSRFMKRAA
jgi:hypothetical protein